MSESRFCPECQEYRLCLRETRPDLGFTHLVCSECHTIMEQKELPKLPPEFQKKYEESQNRQEGNYMWRRSNGELIPIKKMNPFHLSGAANLTVEFAKQTASEKGGKPSQYLPEVYIHLADEMRSRGMTPPEL